MEPPRLDALGRRIVICGPSNAGKSTLAQAIARKLDIPAVHLDQLHHLPHTDWVPRPAEDFVALHDAAIAGDAWVMDGNYSRLFPQRLARATGAIVLRSRRWSSFARYLRRTLFEKGRAGSLAGSRDSIKWQMVRWILVVQPALQGKYIEAIRAAGLPTVEVDGMPRLKALYAAWGLQPPTH